ncbi:MAG: ribosome maturation factor RimM [Christensenellaceae bacterium]|jgi:16S rRNA processing protein RimM
MEYLEIAVVVKPQGIKGEVKLRAYVDDVKRFLSLPHVYLKQEDTYKMHKVERAWVYKGFAYLKIAGYEDRNAAELLRGISLYIDREHAATPEAGHYFIADLLGHTIKDETGHVYGALQDVIQTGGVDVYHVKGEEEILFPLAPGVVIEIDMAQKEIIVDLKRLSEVMVHAGV